MKRPYQIESMDVIVWTVYGCEKHSIATIDCEIEGTECLQLYVVIDVARNALVKFKAAVHSSTNEINNVKHARHYHGDARDDGYNVAEMQSEVC
ncbi:hypothetical protein HPP92_013779 [Vanilla planifolia]|nr:hypothetical protein HPP92_013779 [Vanilla planifolia]